MLSKISFSMNHTMKSAKNACCSQMYEASCSKPMGKAAGSEERKA